MLENKSQNKSLLDKLFSENPAADEFLASQISESKEMLHRIDKELSDTLIKNIPLIQRLSAYDSLPVADRYSLVPMKAIHDKDCSILRIMLDDLEEMLSLTSNEKDRQTLISLRRDCFNLLSSATQNAVMLQAGIQGTPISETLPQAELAF